MFPKQLLANSYVNLFLKTVFSCFILFIFSRVFFATGIDPYYSIKNYQHKNEFQKDELISINQKKIKQHFFAKGNILTNLSLFVDGGKDHNLHVKIKTLKGETIFSKNIKFETNLDKVWTDINLSSTRVERGHEYVIILKSREPLSFLFLDRGDYPSIFTSLKPDTHNPVLVFGIEQTYRYLTLGNIFRFGFTCLGYLFLVFILIFSVFNIEKIAVAYCFSEKKRGFFFALYSSISLIMVFNPAQLTNHTITSFNRILGQATLANVDVASRISCFSNWFICFSISFLLFFLLYNYLLNQEFSLEKKKVLSFLNILVNVALVKLFFSLLSFFKSDTLQSFDYSSSLIALFFVLCLVYIFLNLDKYIEAEYFYKLQVAIFCFVLPVVILLQLELQSETLMFGFQAFFMILAAILCKFVSYKNREFLSVIDSGVICFSFFPLLTSLYIESINILNQRYVFIKEPRTFYFDIFLLVVLVFLLVSLILYKKQIIYKNWKTCIYSVLIAGFTSLSIQLPLIIQSRYPLFEAANYGILINDFLNFKSIPIVQHYGGHMLTSFFGGIFYAFLNNDFKYAVYSPYSVYILVSFALIFFFFIKNFLGSNLAFFITLFFPYGYVWNYYGFGLLTCLCFLFYLKRPSFLRASFVVLSVGFILVSKLDMGYCILLSLFVSVPIYSFYFKEWKIVKNLFFAFLIFGFLGTILWFSLCYYLNIDPISRIFEFLYISLSNQNWGRAGIGDPEKVLFPFVYLFVPFFIAIALIFLILSNRLKEEKYVWFLLVFLGFVYFFNFSRGLVRHSFAEEGNYRVYFYDAYLFIALFLASYFKIKKELFLPALSCLIFISVTFDDKFSIINFSQAILNRSTQSWTLNEFDFDEIKKDKNGDIIFPKTIWEELYDKKKRVARIECDGGCDNYTVPYASLIRTLLKKDETFVEFGNKNFIYPALSRKSPVYISQTPMQLSGEFTQEKYIEQIKASPLIFMPVRYIFLDGLNNYYRYYKVSEFIYQNYQPFLLYRDFLALWISPKKYQEYKRKIKRRIFPKKGLKKINLYLSKKNIKSSDSMIEFELNDLFRFKPLENMDVSIIVTLDNSDLSGEKKLFYSKNEDKTYEKNDFFLPSINKNTLIFSNIRISSDTIYKLSLTKNFKVNSISINPYFSFISSDSKILNTFKDSSNFEFYKDGVYTYKLDFIPYIWGTLDGAINNRVYANLKFKDDFYSFDDAKILSKKKGNYLLIRANFPGSDRDGLFRDDDETCEVNVTLGVVSENDFYDKSKYLFSLKEGEHDYLIRVSSDYSWYSDNINGVKIQNDCTLENISMKILEGD